MLTFLVFFAIVTQASVMRFSSDLHDKGTSYRRLQR